MNVGLDVGYANVKIVADNLKAIFPSIVGTPDRAKTGAEVASDSTMTIQVAGEWYNVGAGANLQSRFTFRSEDRDWINTKEYMALFHAALLTLAGNSRSLTINCLVTGLPISFHSEDSPKLKELFTGQHRVATVSGEVLTVEIKQVVVIPQGMGAVISEALDDNGTIKDGHIASGKIGIIDIGGKTTNIIHSQLLLDVARETASVDLGGWDAVRAAKEPLLNELHDLDIRDHQISEAIMKKSISWRGAEVDLTELIDAAIEPLAREIVSQASQLWPGGGALLSTILLSGGGATLLGNHVKELLDHSDIRILESPEYANALGYYRLANKEA